MKINGNSFLVVKVITSLFLSIGTVSANEQGTHSMKEMFQRLVKDNPTVILLDDPESELEYTIRESLEAVQNAGSVVFTFNPWWKFWKQRIKPKIGAIRTTPYRWTFICLLEERRTKNRAGKYLQELLSVGNGRDDRFILLGMDKQLTVFLKSKETEKFQNLVAVPIDKNLIYQRHVGIDPTKQLPRFVVVHELQSVFWITRSTISLHGQHFRISGTRFPPYLDWVYHANGSIRLMGQNFRIFQEGGRYHNYTFRVNPVNHWKLTGKKLPNGTFDGVYGDLVYGRADIASVSTQTVDRNGYADFVGPFGRAHLVFVTSPPEKHLGKYAVFKSYTLGVWLFILGFFAVFVVLFQQAFQIAEAKKSVKHNGRLFIKSLLLVWSLSFEQTEEKRPKGIRLLMIMWVAFIVVIGTGFRSNLAASMSFPVAEDKPRTFKALSDNSGYKINFDLSGISAWNHFEETTNPVLRKIQRRSQTMENTTECVVKSFMNQNTVCIGWDFTLKSAAAKNLTIPQLNNPLIESSDAAWAAWYTFALEKNSIFTQAFQFIGQSFFETGFTAYWRGRLLEAYREYGLKWTNTQENSAMYKRLSIVRSTSKTETKPLKVENFEFIFFILVAGLFISLLRFCYEIWGEEGTAGAVCKKRGYLRQSQSRRHRKITVQSKVIPIDFMP